MLNKGEYSMQIIIDIPNEWYEDLLLNGASTGLGRAVLKGVPLPKKHGKIGDLDAMHKSFKESCRKHGINNMFFLSEVDMNFDLAESFADKT